MKKIYYQITQNGTYFDIIENTIENGKLTKWKIVKTMCFETEEEALIWITMKETNQSTKKYDISLYIQNDNGEWEEDTRVKTNSAIYAYNKLVRMQYDESGAISQRYYTPKFYIDNKTKRKSYIMEFLL